MDGRTWAYYDTEGMVLLPNSPGEHRLEVELVEAAPAEPRVTRTGACVTAAAYDARHRVLEVETGLPPWVRSLPEEQLYMALVGYDKKRFRRSSIEGAKVEKEGELGDIVAFKPGKMRIGFDALG